MIKGIILMPKQLDGCTWYRLEQFAKRARKMGLADIAFIDLSLPADQLYEAFRIADFFIYRLNDHILELFDELDFNKLRKPMILDMDDKFEDIDPLSDMYKLLGTKEVVLKDGTYLWKHGENGFDMVDNTNRVARYVEAMKRADAVITTCFNLKNYISQYNKNVVIIPNAIDFDIFPSIDLRKGNEVRIVYAGGASHFADLYEVKDELAGVLTKYPNVHFYFLGQVFGSLLKYLPKDKVHPYGWINADGHGWRLACMGGDIGICPLVDNEFNVYKSSVKYYEYSALRMATVARNIPPYADDVRHNYSGYLYKSRDEFSAYLEELIENPVKRLVMANNAYNYVKANRNLDEVTKDWAGFFQSVVDAFKAQRGPAKEDVEVETIKPFTIDPLRGKDVKKVLDKGLALMDGTTHWVSSGTLLGMYRDHKFIGHDTDIDVNMLVSQSPDFLIEKFEKAGFELIMTQKYEGKYMQMAFRGEENIIFDVYPFYKGIKEGVAVNYNMEGVIEKPLKYIEKPGGIEFEGRKYPVPAHLEEYLVWRFGKGWQTPKKAKVPWQEEATHIKRW